MRKFVTSLKVQKQTEEEAKQEPKIIQKELLLKILCKNVKNLTDKQKQYLNEILNNYESINELHSLMHELISIIQERQEDKLYVWLSKAIKSSLIIIKNFAKQINGDLDAISNSLKYHYNNGLLEGHVNRLKVIKRQMYGRANFDLVRQKVLYRI
jgi:transposase